MENNAVIVFFVVIVIFFFVFCFCCVCFYVCMLLQFKVKTCQVCHALFSSHFSLKPVVGAFFHEVLHLDKFRPRSCLHTPSCMKVPSVRSGTGQTIVA